ncbi:MAG: sigma-70 family RNA polymerase sigma factor [Bacteroidales bacterium]|nr:sigma-70 family RNA polymerase sigma factor [Bacteroidales bacterium]
MERLVELAKEGDAQAQNALYRRYKNRSLAVCRRITHDTELSEELANDAFLIAFDKLGCLNDPEKFGSWLSAISARVALRHLKRKEEKTIPLSCLEGFDAACEDTESAFTSEELQKAIDMLPQGYRQVFTMSVIEGRQHKEIASLLNIEPHSSSSQLYHARAMLRRILGPLLCVVLIVLTIPVLLVQDRQSVPSVGAALRPKEVVEKVEKSERKECVNEEMSGNGISPRPQEDAVNLRFDSIVTVDDVGLGLREGLIVGPESWKEPVLAEVATDIPVIMQQALGDRDDDGRWSVKVSMAASLSGQAVARRPHALLLPSVSCTSGVPGECVAINNWRECRRYVIENLGLFSPEVAEALIRIAQNNEVDNDGQIICEERHEPPVRFCMEVNMSIRPWAWLHCGLGWGMYRSWFQTGFGKDRIDGCQSVTYLDIPAGMSCRLFDSPRFACYFDVELALQAPVSVRYNTQFVVGEQTNLSKHGDEDEWFNGIPLVDQASYGGHLSMEARMKVGVRYKLLKHFELFSECSMGCNLFRDERIATFATSQQVGLSIQSGLQFNF